VDIAERGEGTLREIHLKKEEGKKRQSLHRVPELPQDNNNP
jgi:hypothetical protein